MNPVHSQLVANGCRFRAFRPPLTLAFPTLAHPTLNFCFFYDLPTIWGRGLGGGLIWPIYPERRRRVQGERDEKSGKGAQPGMAVPQVGPARGKREDGAEKEGGTDQGRGGVAGLLTSMRTRSFAHNGDVFSQSGGQGNQMVLFILENLANMFCHRILTHSRVRSNRLERFDPRNGLRFLLFQLS
jgi:hypothetical protein